MPQSTFTGSTLNKDRAGHLTTQPVAAKDWTELGDWRKEAHIIDFDDPWYFEPPQYLVEGLLEKEDSLLLTGAHGAGKTFLLADLALCLLGVRDEFLGSKIIQRGPVVYFDMENHERKVRNRLLALGATPEYVGGGRLVYVKRPLSFDNSADRTFILDVVRDVKPVMTVFDSYVSFIGGEDENAAAVMRKMFDNAVKPVIKAGSAAVLLDHLSKPTPGGKSRDPNYAFRGSGDKGAAVDRIWSLSADPVDEELITMSFGRSRNDKRHAPMLIRRTGDYRRTVRHVVENAAMPVTRGDVLDSEILEFLEAHDGKWLAGIKKMAKEIGVSDQRISERLPGLAPEFLRVEETKGLPTHIFLTKRVLPPPPA